MACLRLPLSQYSITTAGGAQHQKQKEQGSISSLHELCSRSLRSPSKVFTVKYQQHVDGLRIAIELHEIRGRTDNGTSLSLTCPPVTNMPISHKMHCPNAPMLHVARLLSSSGSNRLNLTLMRPSGCDALGVVPGHNQHNHTQHHITPCQLLSCRLLVSDADLQQTDACFGTGGSSFC